MRKNKRKPEYSQPGTGGELVCEMVPSRLKERDLESLPG